MARRKLKMSTPAEVRATITKIANMTLNAEIDTKQANALLYACNTQLGAIRTDVQQAKIEELENFVEGLKNGGI